MGDLEALGHGPFTPDPFGEAWRTRDLDRWIDALAPDVVLHSPLLSTPFRGRQVARDLYEVLFATFGEFTITDRSRSGDTEIIAWRGDLKHRTVEGVDVIRYRPEGDIAEVRVLMRPLTAIGVFASAVGPPFARRRSRAAGAVTRLLSAPFGPLFRIVDRVSPRLLPLGSESALDTSHG
jgi:ketosteroid isomerase-like protein